MARKATGPQTLEYLGYRHKYPYLQYAGAEVLQQLMTRELYGVHFSGAHSKTPLCSIIDRHGLKDHWKTRMWVLQ